jgi:ubiquinone/menaquinone biosynthesis C-methylase UbiE
MTEVVEHAVEAGSIFDGYLYDKLIAPMAVWLEDMILGLIAENCTVLEIGCGPGALACRLANKCSKVTAIDISKRMIEYANRKKKKLKIENDEFVCIAAAQLSEEMLNPFDYAVSSFCLHEMEPQQRPEVVRNCLLKSGKMIIADYRAPFPKSITALGNTIMEKLAGKRHYRNFYSWQASGGIDGFIERLCLTKINEIEWNDRCGKTIVVTA